MIKNWKLKSAITGIFALAVMPAHAQAPLELEYQQTQQMLNAAIKGAVGSFDAMLILPQAAFENPLQVRADLSGVVAPESRLEIKGEDVDLAGAEVQTATSEFLTKPEGYFLPFEERTQTFAVGAIQADNSLHWALHGDRLYLTPAPARDAELREQRGLSVKASSYLSQSDAFRGNANFSASRPGR